MVLSVNEQAFTQEVLESPIPVLVNFWAPWCGLCRAIEPILTRFQAEWGTHIKLVNVNADENLKLASTYRLTNLPTLLVFEKGAVLQRIDTFRGRDEVRRALENILAVSTASADRVTH